jgi:hypothetical protein
LEVASLVVLVGVRIEGSIFGNQESRETQRLADIKDLCPADRISPGSSKK